MIDIVGQITSNQHISRKELALRIDFPAAAYLDNMLCWDKNLLELARKSALRRLFLNRLGDFSLEIRIGVNDVPAHAHKKIFNLPD
jgi:hypothetical protein